MAGGAPGRDGASRIQIWPASRPSPQAASKQIRAGPAPSGCERHGIYDDLQKIDPGAAPGLAFRTARIYGFIPERRVFILNTYKEHLGDRWTMVRGDSGGHPGVQEEADADPPVPPPRIAIEVGSATVLQGHREIVIRHAGHRYRLRITANDKLILTK